MMSNFPTPKIAIVGVGAVGATAAFALMISGVASEIVLIDVNEDKAEGEAMDLAQGAPFLPPVNVYAGKYADCAGAQIVVITAGAPQKPGETRLDLVKKNVAIFREMIPQIAAAAPGAVLLVVANPVDILTYASVQISGLSPSRIVGSGTVLDTARLRTLIGQRLRIDSRSVHAHVIGEHGDSEVVVWSRAISCRHAYRRILFSSAAAPAALRCKLKSPFRSAGQLTRLSTARVLPTMP